MVERIIKILKILWRLPEIVEQYDKAQASFSDSLEDVLGWVEMAAPIVETRKLLDAIKEDTPSIKDVEEAIRALQTRKWGLLATVPINRNDIKARNEQLEAVEAEIIRLNSQKESMT
jgi:DNA repair ATPase RecN